jgi:glycosyltransferase involved in cell wall biosynthesis
MSLCLPKLSIVCPAFEEEEVLPHFHWELCAILDPLETEFEIEILYVDDGSRDRTLAVLRNLAAADTRVGYLSFSRNFGHQAALTAGLEHAAGDVVITLDSDLQHPPRLIPELLRKWRDGFDVVLTVRAEDPQLGLVKRVTSRLFYTLMRRLSDTEIRFAAADFRLLSRRAVAALLQLRETHRFLRGMVQWLGFATTEVRFHPAARKAGASKYTLRRMTNFAVDALLSFSRLPLRLPVFLGLGIVALGVLFSGILPILALFGSAPVSFEWGSLLVAVHLIGGSILIGLGVVGEYVGRIYEQVKGRPLYLLKETSEDREASAPRDAQPGTRRPRAA